jgi:hypothetical protein
VIEPAKKSKSPGPDLSKINGGTAAREISLGTQQKIALYFRGIRARLTRQADTDFKLKAGAFNGNGAGGPAMADRDETRQGDKPPAETQCNEHVKAFFLDLAAKGKDEWNKWRRDALDVFNLALIRFYSCFKFVALFCER